MRKSKHLSIATTCVCLWIAGLTTGVIAQEPELIVEVDSQEIYEGESILYRVTLNHVADPMPPTLMGLDDFQVTTLGEQSLDSRQITIINGRRSEVVRRGRQYNYRLIPKRSGTITIPAPTASVDGDVITGRAVTVVVKSPDDQDVVILEFASDRDAVYPMQPFELSITIAVKGLPGEFEDRDPLSVQPKPPALNVPWLTDEQLPDGIEPEKSWREILEPLIDQRGAGVQVNNIGSSSVFSMFDSRKTGFHPQPKRTTRKDADGNDTRYWEYVFKRTLIPKRLGTYQFGPVSINGTFASGAEGGQLLGDRFYALAKSIDVTVQDVPLDGRPDSYIGAVGTFDVKAQLAPTTAQVGDPMTLTVTLSGKGTLAEARAPAIEELPGISDAFRTYEATEEMKGNSRRFTYSLRPLSQDVVEFPEIPVSFFDVEAEQYVTNRTEPIPVTIREAETLSDTDIVSAPPNADASPGGLEAREGGIFANDSGLNSFRNETVQPDRWVVTWAGMVGVWMIASLSIGRVRRRREDPSIQRRRNARGRADAALEEASTHLASGNTADTCDALQRAITGLIADYSNTPEAGLTPRDAVEQLRLLGVDDSTQTRTLQLLEHCDAARYGAATDDATRLKQEASELIKQLSAELRRAKTPTSSRPHAATSAIVLFGLFCAGCGSAPDLETSRQFQDAEQAFGAASSPSDFARVAGQYEQIIDAGVVSGAVLYNQGNAWMRAGETGRAIASYRQAQRFRPRDPYLAANLQNAISSNGRSASSKKRTSIAGYVFFWQNWMSYPEKFLATTVLLALALLAALLKQVTSMKLLFSRLSMAAAVLCLLSAAATARDWHRFDRTMHGVVIADQVTARKGNSENYEAAFTESLSEGEEFTVLEERGDWLNIQVGESGIGWIEKRAATLF